MKNELTELIFLLDRSGSMEGLERDTIGGFNGFIEKQKRMKGKTNVSTVLFDDQYEILWNGVDISRVKLTEKEYFVRGTTALLDAIGKTILKVSNRMNNVEERAVPDHVIFVITTDGMENSSVEYNFEQIRKLINHKKELEHWEFIFLGANMDSVKEASRLGISNDDAFNFEPSSSGVLSMYEMVNEEIVMKRNEKRD